MTNFSKIKLLVLDVDGVLTDGSVYYSSSGEKFKKFSARDGMGIACLRRVGVEIAAISTSKEDLIKHRLHDLKLENFKLGVENKYSALLDIANKLNIDLKYVAYISDDINDVISLRRVGTSIAVPNAAPEVKITSDYITFSDGGNGAVREICDLIIKEKELDIVDIWENGYQ